jgi:hypothetical protein
MIQALPLDTKKSDSIKDKIEPKVNDFSSFRELTPAVPKSDDEFIDDPMEIDFV